MYNTRNKAKQIQKPPIEKHVVELPKKVYNTRNKETPIVKPVIEKPIVKPVIEKPTKPIVHKATKPRRSQFIIEEDEPTTKPIKMKVKKPTVYRGPKLGSNADKYNKLAEKLGQSETYTKIRVKTKYDHIKENIPPKQDYNFQADSLELLKISC